MESDIQKESKEMYLSMATAASVLTDALTATPCKYGAALHRNEPHHHSVNQKEVISLSLVITL